MKIRTFPFLIISLLMLALWWFWPLEKAKEKQSSAHVARMKTSDFGKKNIDVAVSTTKSHNDEQTTHELIPAEESIIVDADWLYLDVYRKYQWAQLCQQYFSRKESDKSLNKEQHFDFQHWFIERQKMLNNLTGVEWESSIAQKQILGSYTAHCERVIAFLRANDSSNSESFNNYRNVEKITEILKAIEPVTDKEKIIKLLLGLNNSMSELFGEVLDLAEGENTWSEQKIAAHRMRVDEIQRQARFQSKQSDTESQVVEMYRQLQQQRYVDLDKINIRINEWMSLYLKVSQQLLSQDNDIFYLAKTQSEMMPNYAGLGVTWNDSLISEYLDAFETAGESLMKKIGVGNTAVFNQVALPASILYLCSLGEDCSQDSLLMTSYCLGLNGLSINQDACGRDLIGFYFESYLSPNLQQDVELMLEFIEIEYGS